MTSVILHGALAKKFGAEHRYLVRKPIDAIRALMANKRGFRRVFKTWGREGKLYEIICDGKKVESINDLKDEREIKRLDIAPVLVGGSNAGKIIVGIILVIVSIYAPGAAGSVWGAALQGAGMGLIIGGIMGILFPPPVPQFTAEAQSKSFIFSTLENSASQGIAIPLGYGRIRIGTKVISTEISPHRLSSATPAYTGPIGGNEDSFNGLEVYRRMEQDRVNETLMAWTMQNYWWERQDPISKEGGV